MDIKDIIADIEDQIEICREFGESLDHVSWNYEEGVLISANVAQRIVEALKSKAQK